MVRTQIYITAEERVRLRALSRQTGLSQSELIRQAIDSMLRDEPTLERSALLQQARGLWSERTDLPDFGALRVEFDRSESAVS